MPEEVRLSTFPETEYDALALLYVQNQDLNGLTPAQVFDLYFDARKEIRDHGRERKKADRKS